MERKDKDLMVSADAVTEAEKEGKKKLRKEQWKNFWQKGFMLIVILVLIILLLAKCESGGFRTSVNEPEIGTEQTDKNGRPIFSTDVDENAQEGATIGKSREEIQKELNEKAKNGNLTMSGNSLITLTNGTSTANIDIINYVIKAANPINSDDYIQLLKPSDDFKKVISVYNVPMKITDKNKVSVSDVTNPAIVYTSGELNLMDSINESELTSVLSKQGLDNDLSLYSQKVMLFDKDETNLSPENAIHVFDYSPVKYLKISNEYKSNDSLYLLKGADDYKKITLIYNVPVQINKNSTLTVKDDGNSSVVYTSKEMGIKDAIDTIELSSVLTNKQLNSDINMYSQKVMLFDKDETNLSPENAIHIFDYTPINKGIEVVESNSEPEITQQNAFPQVIQIYLKNADGSDGEMIYQSGMIPLGSSLTNVKFKKNLAKGEYMANEYFNAVNTDGSYMGKSCHEIKIVVQN